MGHGYSSPPRGHLYSITIDDEKNKRYFPELKPQEKEFTNYQSMFLDHFNEAKKLPFLKVTNEETKIYTYENIFKASQSFLSSAYSSGGKISSISTYSTLSLQTFIIYNAALLNGITIIPYNSEETPIKDFISGMRTQRPTVIFVDQSNLQRVKSDCNFSRVIQINDSLFNSNEGDLKEVKNDSVCIIHGNSKVTQEECCNSLEHWSKLLKISRDTPIASILSYDDQLFRLLLFCVVFNRTYLTIGNQASLSESTHLFVPKKHITDTLEELKKYAAEFHLGYSLARSWKSFFLIFKKTGWLADQFFFKYYQPHYHNEIKCIITSGPLDPSDHYLFTLITTLPVSPVLIPPNWGNVGFGLPPELIYSKIGTLGTPVGSAILYDSEKGLVNLNNDKIYSSSGFWDEEGSGAFTAPRK